MFKNSTLLLSVLLLSSGLPLAEAQTEIPCPSFVGSTENATLYRLKNRHDRKKLKCYRDKSEAKKAGFKPAAAIAKQSYEGWWRLKLKATASTCPSGPQLGEGPAQFVQILDNMDTAFAHFCPAEETLSGFRDSEGVNLSTTYILNEVPDPQFCTDGKVEVNENLKMHRIIDKGHEFGARYSITRRCLKESDSDKACSTSYSGVAFLETHEIWPEVATTFSQFKPQCVKALDTCVGCHPNFSDIPKLE